MGSPPDSFNIHEWHTSDKWVCQICSWHKKRRALALQVVDQVTEVIKHRIKIQLVLCHQRLKLVADAIELLEAFSVGHESVVEVRGISPAINMAYQGLSDNPWYKIKLPQDQAGNQAT